MTLGRLWAGWRMPYVSDAAKTPSSAQPPSPTPAGAAPEAPDPCVFCRILAAGLPDRESYVVWRGRACVAILNAFPYASGHLMAMPVRHVDELEGLEAAEAAELWETITDAVSALKAAYRPEGVNVGFNLGRAAGAGIPGHLHAHVVPRWNGDTNFMTTLAETRVLPEALHDTWDRLRSAWPRDLGSVSGPSARG